MTRFTLGKHRYNRILRIALPTVFWLSVWQFAATGVGQELLLPAPSAVLRALFQQGQTLGFWQATGQSLLSIFGGMAGGVLSGVLIAILTTFFAPADWILSPAVKVIRATPVASFIILVLLWVKRAYVPGVISGLMVLPVLWMNVSKGLSETDPLLLELAQTYRFSPLKTLRLIYLPSIKPYFVSGVQTALGLAWKSGVAAEVLCLPKSAIGTQLYYSKLYLETPSLFAWTFVVIVLSFLLEWVLRLLLERRHMG
jgi:NitT/TauT family transport system permease protein